MVPVDVGKSMAMSLIADHYGEVVNEPFGFDLTEGADSSRPSPRRSAHEQPSSCASAWKHLATTTEPSSPD